jgi:hypothetical protein
LRTMYPNEESPPTFLALPKLFLNVKYVPTIFPTAFCHLSLVRVQRIMENTIWLELLFCLLLRFRGGMSVLRTCSLVYSSTSPRWCNLIDILIIVVLYIIIVDLVKGENPLKRATYIIIDGTAKRFEIVVVIGLRWMFRIQNI